MNYAEQLQAYGQQVQAQALQAFGGMSTLVSGSYPYAYQTYTTSACTPTYNVPTAVPEDNSPPEFQWLRQRVKEMLWHASS